MVEHLVLATCEVLGTSKDTLSLRASIPIPIWWTVSVAEIGVAIVGVTAVRNIKVMASTKYWPITTAAIDSILVVTVGKHLVLLVQMVFQ